MAARGPSEAQIELSVCHWLRVRGIFFWKQPQSGFFDSRVKRFRKQASPYAMNGCPDIICIYNGLFVGLELKSPKGKQSDSQLEFQRRVEAANGVYEVVRSIEDAAAVFQRLDRILFGS